MRLRRHRLTLVAVSALLVIPSLQGPERDRAARPRNLLVITLDTIRADRLPPYGFAGVETRILDRLAAEGVVFEQTFAAVPLTVPSHATLFTGLYPPRLGVRDNTGAPLAGGFQTLAEVLNERGLATAAFVASGVLATGRGLDQGFGVYADGSTAPCAGGASARRRANEVVDDAVAWLRGQESSPFFVWIHLYDTHRPYDLPDEYLRRYADPYLAAIAFQDAQMSRVIEAVESRNQLNSTLVVVVGDHGESLGDHEEQSHGLFVYDKALHVPFVMRGPGIPPGRVSALTRLVDVMPTVLELFGLATTDVDGVSLVPLATRNGPDPQLDVYSESLYPERFGWARLRSLRDDRYKVIEAPRSELYDLVSDPGEQRNVLHQHPAIGAAMLDRLRDFDDRLDGASKPRPQLDREVAARLSALGYVAGTAEEIPRTDNGQIDPKDRVAEFNRLTSMRWQNPIKLC